MDMDFMDSEIIETLNILRPPVNRSHRKTQQDSIGYFISSTEADLVRDFTQSYKVEKKKNSKRKKSEREVEPALSLIFKKPCKKQIADNYSFVDGEIPHVQKNFNCKNKPIVNVTVVPRKERFSLVKFLKSHPGKNTKGVTSAENIYATKNVYLIVSGGKEQKIYEIKTTGAINTLKDKAKDVKKPNDKYFLNMDKKRKKKIYEKQLEDKCFDENCFCKCKKDNLVQDACAGSSRVRIIGRIELDEDDKYVMKCAATVNGQPVTTDYIKAEADKTPILSSLGDDGSNKTTRESQATQVNIGISGKRCPTIDQNIQCNINDQYHKTHKKEIEGFEDDSKVNSLKGSNSPLVIISVYPKQELSTYAISKADETSPNRLNMQSYRRDQGNINEATRLNTYSLKTDLHNTRVRSPNIINVSRYMYETDKSDDNKRKNMQTSKTFRASRSASPANRTPKTKIQERKKPLFTESNLVKTNNANSPNRLYANDKNQQKENNLNVVKQNKRIIINTNKTEIRKQGLANTRSKSRSRDKSVNTVKLQTNNNLAEGYSKKTSNIKNKNCKRSIVLKDDPTGHDTIIRKSYPKNDISKVSVNIDSEKEFYDVIFEKNKFSTDLTVRKTTKESGSQKYFKETLEENLENYNDENRDSDSLENFFPLEVVGRHRRSNSQAFNNTNGGFTLTQHISRVAVRDSLEIGHRLFTREEGKDLKTQTTASRHRNKHGINEDIDGDFLAPVKHFTGDNCIIGDPVERDKEIRELLGIDKKRIDRKHTDETIVIFERKESNNEQNSSNCFYSKTLWKKKANKNNDPSKEEKNVSTDNEDQEFVQIDVVLKKRDQVQDKCTNDIIRTPIMIMQSTQYEVQEDTSYQNQMSRGIANLLLNKKEPHSKHKAIQLSRKQYRKVKKSMHKISGKRQKVKVIKLTKKSSIVSVGSVKAKRRSEYLIHWNKEVQTDPSLEMVINNLKCKTNKHPKIKQPKNTEYNQEKSVVLYSINKSSNNNVKSDEVRKIASSVEIRFTNIEYMKEVACSFTNIESLESSNKQIKKHYSTETIFRGKKKLHTPNLGASALSLLSEEAKSVSEYPPPDSKPKKPFLKRLMSCLVMRSATSEEAKMVPRRRQQIPTLNSSIDTYHISSSLGAIEMGSSLYDTSASFYSNHTIGPVNKAKRGFLSSVRGLLSTRKS